MFTDYIPSSIALSIFGFSIHWYALCILAGIIAGYSVLRYFLAQGNYEAAIADDALLWVILCAILGGRMYYVVYAWEYYAQNLSEIWRIDHGGLAIHGVLLGGLFGLYIFTRRNALSFTQLLSYILPGVALGQALGRWGNYFNQELFGTPTDLPWGIPIAPLNRPEAFIESTHFHPTFLYESVLNFVLFIILFAILSRTKKQAELLVIGTYAIGYGVIRFSTELLRTDFTPYLFGLRIAQVASIILVLIGMSILTYRCKLTKSSK
jgi:phosphatidylglycerol:prolipoprotein diacylglycerol transferase